MVTKVSGYVVRTMLYAGYSRNKYFEMGTYATRAKILDFALNFGINFVINLTDSIGKKRDSMM
jgi:hypothetical protein